MIIDADTHFLPPDIYDYVGDEFAALCPQFVWDDKGLLVDVQFPGAPPRVPGSTPLPPPGTGARYRGAYYMDERLADYAKLGIDKQFLFPQLTSALFTYLIEPRLANAMAHSWNLSILKLLKRYPDALIGGALVALQDVDNAIREMEWARENGFCAVILDKVFPVKEHCYSDPFGSHRELWPFFARAEALGMPLFLHNIQHGHRITNLLNYQYNGLDVLAPQEGQMSLVSLITSGLLDDFPKLNFVFTEAGVSFIKPLVAHLDSVFKNEVVDYESEDAAPRFNYRKLEGGKRIVSPEDYKAKNRKAPSDYFKSNLYFTIETEEAELTEAVQLFGASQFLFATDYPHDDPGGRMKYKDVQLFTDNRGISEADKALIWSGNAERLLSGIQ
ncbi:MAG TPA: amidohydrolase family protein [Burkholderiales bacterium]|nr:amidohydrolase family protein [Burkholderiales bacterium]